MSALISILNTYREMSQTEREKGTYFELLTKCYLENEASYKDLYSDVWMYSDWAKIQGIDARDTGIDLVARTADTDEFHAIQCKLYAEDYTLQKGDIDSFFTASGKKIFKHRIIVSTTNKWSKHAEGALVDQVPPVTKIDLHDLEVSQIDWNKYQPKEKVVLRDKKVLRPDQTEALTRVKVGLANNERGQLIMACGTGKTFTSLKIAEVMAGKSGRVLFLVPSLSLLSQTLTEWTQESSIPLHSFAVCSDSDVGKKKIDDDIIPMLTHELRYPATTDAKSLSREIRVRHDKNHMSVVFSTYHSIEVISKAQKKYDLEEFDIIICDEAHRTTGATFENEDEKLICVSDHVDGSMNASEKEAKLNWLKAESYNNECRILSNVRCLSEGVDVPALDAVLFLTPRNSQVDVVQSVGRVMRNAPGKKRGYVILPVVIPAGVTPHEALNDNKTYRVVWQVLQALRSHDDRFDAMINKMDLDLNRKMLSKMEVVSITDKIAPKAKKTKRGDRASSSKGEYNIGVSPNTPSDDEYQGELQFEVGELERAIYAKVVQKCGNRHHWEDWANDIAKIARTHIDRITAIVEDPKHEKEKKAFQEFAGEIRDDLNDSIPDTEIIEMLAQHLITKPVFDALFSDYSFAKNNPVSQAMQDIIDLLHAHNIQKEADTLESFYESVRFRAEGIDNAAGKQKIVVELYDKFFRNAFPKMTEKLGIVYTPVEVVDFIIHSVNDILQKEFGQTLGSKGVHIIDPFTGTGTFITRLLQSGLIKPEELKYKYENEIHANEIVLLAYYIAAINIEAVYHTLSGGEYTPFKGICLTDTFQLYEKDDLISHYFEDNSNRRNRQKNLDIRVIMGNPPYSVGQKSANDNAQNQAYPVLDKRIEESYANESNAGLNKSLYDAYIKAFRWASDRIESKDGGIICFVSNGAWLDGNSQDGFRKCLEEEFSSIYVFNLRGNQRTSGELSRKEGGKIFGSGSRTPIAITLLVKKTDTSKKKADIHYHDIGDYLSQKEKLDIIASFKSVGNSSFKWKKIKPNTSHDWINMRNEEFDNFVALNPDKKFNLKTESFFNTYAVGISTARDYWVYNFSKKSLIRNMNDTISFYNQCVSFHKKNISDDNMVNDPTKISWSVNLKKDLTNLKSHKFLESNI